MKSALSLLALCALTACGGGGSESLTEHPQPVCVQPVEVVGLFGDSTQAGSITRTTEVDRPPAVLLQSALDQRFGAGVVQVVDRAVGGTTLAQLRAGADGLNQPWPKSLTGMTRAVVNHAINDTREHVTAAEIADAYRAMTAQSPIPVMVQTPVPIQPWWVEWPGLQDALAATAAAMRKLPNVIDVNAMTFAPTEQPDGIHPTQAAYERIVSDHVAPAVIAAIEAARCEATK